jgi:hypothetical protein
MYGMVTYGVVWYGTVWLQLIPCVNSSKAYHYLLSCNVYWSPPITLNFNSSHFLFSSGNSQGKYQAAGNLGFLDEYLYELLLGGTLITAKIFPIGILILT